MKISRTAIGIAIRTVREAAGMTLKDLAKVSGISFSLLSRTELGDRDVSYVEMLSILQALNVRELTLRRRAEMIEQKGLSQIRQRVRDLNRQQREAIHNLIDQQTKSIDDK